MGDSNRSEKSVLKTQDSLARKDPAKGLLFRVEQGTPAPSSLNPKTPNPRNALSLSRRRLTSPLLASMPLAPESRRPQSVVLWLSHSVKKHLDSSSSSSSSSASSSPSSFCLMLWVRSWKLHICGLSFCF